MQANQQEFVARAGHELAHKLTFVMNFGQFVVQEVKLLKGQPTQTFKLFLEVPVSW